MTIGSIFFGIALLVVLALFLARPFLLTPVRHASRRSEKEELLAEKEALLAEIRAIDFDYDTGKLPSDVYDPQRQRLVQRAAAVMQALDAYQTQPDEQAPGLSDDIDARIESAIARLRAKGKEAAAPAPVKVREGQHKGGYCPQCGQPTDVDDKFCTACGHRLGERQAVTS